MCVFRTAELEMFVHFLWMLVQNMRNSPTFYDRNTTTRSLVFLKIMKESCELPKKTEEMFMRQNNNCQHSFSSFNHTSYSFAENASTNESHSSIIIINTTNYTQFTDLHKNMYEYEPTRMARVYCLFCYNLYIQKNSVRAQRRTYPGDQFLLSIVCPWKETRGKSRQERLTRYTSPTPDGGEGNKGEWNRHCEHEKQQATAAPASTRMTTTRQRKWQRRRRRRTHIA